ncbi:MAG: dCTP deaminase [Acidobacteria bacterium]|nr:dCTP deaminase [Acidobacteriota bacterium]
MAIKPDHWIVRMAREHRMIDPFEEKLVSAGAISFGVSSYGYDFRLSNSYKLFRGGSSDRLDPKDPQADLFEDFEGPHCLVAPHSFLLARSLEYFRIPRDVLTICAGKSTYARCGIIVNVTPFEPEWEGHVTMSICNSGPTPVKIYSGEGIAQLLFLEASEICRVSYRDRKGKYQSQQGIVLSKQDKS